MLRHVGGGAGRGGTRGAGGDNQKKGAKLQCIPLGGTSYAPHAHLVIIQFLSSDIISLNINVFSPRLLVTCKVSIYYPQVIIQYVKPISMMLIARGGERWNLLTPPLSLRACGLPAHLIRSVYVPHTMHTLHIHRWVLERSGWSSVFSTRTSSPVRRTTRERRVWKVWLLVRWSRLISFKQKRFTNKARRSSAPQLCFRNAIPSLVVPYDDGLDVLTQFVFDCVLQESVDIQTQVPQSVDVFLDRTDLMPLDLKLLKVFGDSSLRPL